MMKYVRTVAIFLGAALTMAAAETGGSLRSAARRLEDDETPNCCEYEKVCKIAEPDICGYMCIEWCGYSARTTDGSIAMSSNLSLLRHDGQGTVRFRFVASSQFVLVFSFLHCSISHTNVLFTCSCIADVRGEGWIVVVKRQK